MAHLEGHLHEVERIEAMGQLAVGIARRFNNLLMVIEGYSQLSLSEIKDNHPLKENIEEIQKVSEQALALTHYLMMFSGRQVLEVKEDDLNVILRNLEGKLRQVISGEVDLSIRLSGHSCKIKTYPPHIEQAILHLAVNASEAIRGGGRIDIETANVKLDENSTQAYFNGQPGNYAVLSVSDTGCGMPPEVKKRIFEPFFTTKGSDKKEGLGLSAVYGIVKQHGGYIWVYSEPGCGSTFRMYLPLWVEEGRDILFEDRIILPKKEKETILLVEDDSLVRRLAFRILSDHGFKVIEASDGEEALRVLQNLGEEEIHLLLTDVVMPKMDGRELSGRIKILRPDIKILFTSGYGDHRMIFSSALQPGEHFLEKPFSSEDLIRKIHQVLDG